MAIEYNQDKVMKDIGIKTSENTQEFFEIGADAKNVFIQNAEHTQYGDVDGVVDLQTKLDNFNKSVRNIGSGNATNNYATAFGYRTSAEGEASHAEGAHSIPSNGVTILTRAKGAASHAEGRGTISSGEAAHSEGYLTQVGNTATLYNYNITPQGAAGAHAEGLMTIATKLAAHAEGIKTQATSPASHTEGEETAAMGRGSHAEGGNTSAQGIYSHAEGHQTIAKGYSSHTEGYKTSVGPSAWDLGELSLEECDYHQAAHAEGIGTQAKGKASHAEGFAAKALGDVSHAEGEYTKAMGKNSHAEGSPFYNDGQQFTKTLNINDTTYTLYGSWAQGEGSHAEGVQTFTLGKGSHAEGVQTEAHGEASHAEGIGTKALRDASHAEGCYTIAYAPSSHAEGESSHAEGVASHAEGKDTIATGHYSHAEGNHTTASGANSHTEGELTIAKLINSHAEGWGTEASANSSHTEGYKTRTGLKEPLIDKIPSIDNLAAHAEGIGTCADNQAAHAEGIFTIAEGAGSHSEGRESSASGEGSHAEGYHVLANGNYSHAEGWQTNSQGLASHTEGYSTVAQGDYSHAEGRDNIAGKNSHVEGGYHLTSYFQEQYILSSMNESVTVMFGFLQGNSFNLQGYKTKSPSLVIDNQAYDTYAYGKLDLIDAYSDSYLTLEPGYYQGQIHGSNTWFDIIYHKLHAQNSDGDFEIYSYEMSGGDLYELTVTELRLFKKEFQNISIDNNFDEFSHIQGKYSMPVSNCAHIVGGGTSDINRKNIHTIDWSGNAEFAGDVIAYGCGGEEPISLKALAERKFIEKEGVGQKTEQGGEIFNDYENNIATGESSHAEGRFSKAVGDYSHAEGVATVANGNYSHAEGHNAKAYGMTSHAEGSGTIAEGGTSHVEGCQTLAQGSYSHVEGYFTNESGEANHVEGVYNNVNTYASHVEGRDHYIASGDSLHVEGIGHKIDILSEVWDGNRIGASLISLNSMGDSHIEVIFINKEPDSSGGAIAGELYPIKYPNLTQSQTSIVSLTIEPGKKYLGSIITRKSNSTTKIPFVLEAITSSTFNIYAKHDLHLPDSNLIDISLTHVLVSQKTWNSPGAHIQGCYSNLSNDKRYLHIVGNGTEELAKNAHTLDWDGNAMFAGDIQFKYNNTIQSLANIIKNLQSQIDELKK